MIRRRLLAAPGVALLALAGAACSGDGDGAANGADITIAGFAYEPDSLSVETGTTITVANTDEVEHTVTARDGSLDTGTIAGGDEAEITVDGEGEVAYFCEIHPYMNGVIRARG